MPLCKNFWIFLVETENKSVFWNNIYKSAFKSVLDNAVISMQYKILFNIIPTNEYLVRVKISNNSICNLCEQAEQTISHLFSECKPVQSFWNQIREWIKIKIGITVTLTKVMKILGHCVMDEMFWPLNFILLLSRRYILWSAKKELQLNIYFFKKSVLKYIKNREVYTKLILS